MSGLRKGLCVALLAFLSSGGVFASVLASPGVEFRQLFALGQNGRVTIDNPYGSVSITAWDRDDVLVEAVKQITDRRGMDDARIVVEPGEGSLSIRTQYAARDNKQPAKVEYRISVPRSTKLEDVKLGNGGLTISGVAGPVKASAINGDIKAEGLEGGADLSTINGQLDAGFDSVHAAQPITLRSVNGAIRLVLPSGAKTRLSAHNVSGGIESEFGRASRVDGAQHLVTYGRGATIRLDNVNGGISIQSALWRGKEPGTDL
jgi:DUF4097 and DUF4098 domain-containing protein YvlB